MLTTKDPKKIARMHAKSQDRCRTIVAGDGGKHLSNVRYRLGHAALTRTILLVGGSLSASSQAFAQDDDFHHNNVTGGVGAPTPVGTLPTISPPRHWPHSAMATFNRLFQAGAGIQIAFGAVNNQNAEVTNFGTLQGGDHEFMIPLGGRVYILWPFNRIEVSAGGAIYLHYPEAVSSNGSGFSPSCFSCTSRGGWGGYGLENVSCFLDSNHNFQRTGSSSPRSRVGIVRLGVLRVQRSEDEKHTEN